ncbi:hypothetical protein HYX17_01140 [Candidatus Woesearchaeota archaeon]|nr:hypothetical protein [Candidatus Woesearchaeota archaeon]
MPDIFDTIILCNECNRKTEKTEIIKDGFSIRTAICPECSQKWYHPSDMEKYNNFQKIKEKVFSVKLRMVGNSYTISIPREIINFNKEFEKRINHMMNLSLEEPEKLSIYFSKRIKELLED